MKLNKKYLGIFVGIFAISLVAAITSYAVFSASFLVLPSITVDGNLVQELGEVYDGETIEGEAITVSNDAPSKRTLSLTDDSPESIVTSYTSELTVAQKVVDFEADVWGLLPDGNTAVIKYTVIGDELVTEVTQGAIEGYEIVYYKDNSDRFNSPAQAIAIGDIVGNLPYGNDANSDEYDYCVTGEYETCNGAKIWYVPTDAIVDGNVNWARASEFLFETSLIQYNTEEVTIYPGSSLEITPTYEIGIGVLGEQTITTTIA